MIENFLLPDSFNTASISVAVTGGIGSGKSTFCSFTAESGYPVLSADLIAKDLLAADTEIIRQIEALFGEEAYLNGNLNTEYLAAKVFNNSENVKLINSIVHPAVIARSGQMLADLKRDNKLVFYEAALIFEANMQELFDVIILITAPDSLKIDRVISRDATTIEKVRARMNNQMPDSLKQYKYGITVNNNGTEIGLRDDVCTIVDILKAKLLM